MEKFWIFPHYIWGRMDVGQVSDMCPILICPNHNVHPPSHLVNYYYTKFDQLKLQEIIVEWIETWYLGTLALYPFFVTQLDTNVWKINTLEVLRPYFKRPSSVYSPTFDIYITTKCHLLNWQINVLINISQISKTPISFSWSGF